MNSVKILLGALILCQIVLSITPAPKAITATQKLMNDLLNNYDHTVRPVQNVTTTTNVTIGPQLISIIATDEAMETITTSFWQQMYWNDEFLTWDPNEYDGITQIMIPLSKMWMPDTVILNMIDGKAMMKLDKNWAFVLHNGTVNAAIDQIATVTCDFEIINFPFDVQNCSLYWSTWTYLMNEVDLAPVADANLGQYSENAEWDLISFTPRTSVTVLAAVMGMPTLGYTNVFFDIVIQRKPTYYLLNFMLPSFIITTLAIIGVFSPFTDSGGREEKVTMGLTTLLTMAVILLIVSQQMPKTSEGLPLLAGCKHGIAKQQTARLRLDTIFQNYANISHLILSGIYTYRGALESGGLHAFFLGGHFCKNRRKILSFFAAFAFFITAAGIIMIGRLGLMGWDF